MPPRERLFSPVVRPDALPEKENDGDKNRRRRPIGLVWWCCCCCGWIGWIVALLLLLCWYSCFTNCPPTPAPTLPPANQTTGPGMVTPGPPAPTSCCPNDIFVGNESTYMSASPTLCGGYDYNCDGEETYVACCFSSVAVVNSVDERIMYTSNSSNCTADLSIDEDLVCGACDGTTVFPGWACDSPVLRKRFILPCPAACDGDMVSVTSVTPPNIGECALFTDHCVGTHGGDGEQCCIVVAY